MNNCKPKTQTHKNKTKTQRERETHTHTDNKRSWRERNPTTTILMQHYYNTSTKVSNEAGD